MRSCSRWRYGLLALTLLLAAGCGAKLDYQKTIAIDSGETQTRKMDAPLVNTATVTVKPSGALVSVYVVLQSNLEAAQKAVDDGGTPKETLAAKEKTSEDFSLPVTLGKKPFAVMVQNLGKKTVEVEVRVEGK